MKQFQKKRITRAKNCVFLAGLIAGSILLSCAAEKQMIEKKAIRVTPPVPTTISGIVVSDTGKTISQARVKAYWREQGYNNSKEVMSGIDGSFDLELPDRPFKIEASKPAYFDAEIKTGAHTILGSLKFVLESSGKINVDIKGINNKKELEFLMVKAISAGKEYHREKNMYIKLALDRIKGIQEDPAAGVTCIISRVPAGPAEVHVSLFGQNLPVQTVAVKEGTVVSVEFKLNRVILSGKLTEHGKPLGEWLLNANPGKIGAQTRADGWYEIKLIPGTYEIELCGPSIAKLQGVTTKAWAPMFTTTYSVTKTETLNLEVSTMKRIESKKSADVVQAQQAQGPFAISGKVTQLGKPGSEWLVTFNLLDGKPASVIPGAKTGSDGSYGLKLNPGSYEIQVMLPSVFEKDGMKLKGFQPKFTTTYTVTKTETLNLEVSILKKIESKKSAEAVQAQQAQGPFVIGDRRLLQLSGPDPCVTDAEIMASSSQGYQIRGVVHFSSGQSHLWCNGAKHTWIGRHENIQMGAIAVIDSDRTTPLQFKIEKEKGYIYQKGKGRVTMPDGKVITLPMSRE